MDITVRYTNNKFTFYKGKNEIIGSFSIEQIIKYFCNLETEYSDIIQTFIGCNKPNITFERTPFMMNIEMIIKLNNGIIKYNKNKLLIFDDDKNYEVSSLFDEFCYKLHIFTIKLIKESCEKIKNDPSRKTVYDSLIRYNSGLTLRTNLYIKNKLDETNEDIDILRSQMTEIINVKSSLYDKIEKVKNETLELNNKLDLLINQSIINQQMQYMQQLHQPITSLTDNTNSTHSTNSTNSTIRLPSAATSMTSDIIAEIVDIPHVQQTPQLIHSSHLTTTVNSPDNNQINKVSDKVNNDAREHITANDIAINNVVNNAIIKALNSPINSNNSVFSPKNQNNTKKTIIQPFGPNELIPQLFVDSGNNGYDSDDHNSYNGSFNVGNFVDGYISD